MKVKAAPGFILVKQIEAEEKQGGIILPESAKERPSKGEVIEIGLETEDKQFEILNPKFIYYRNWSGNQIKVEGEEYVLVKFEDIIAYE